MKLRGCAKSWPRPARPVRRRNPRLPERDGRTDRPPQLPLPGVLPDRAKGPRQGATLHAARTPAHVREPAPRARDEPQVDSGPGWVVEREGPARLVRPLHANRDDRICRCAHPRVPERPYTAPAAVVTSPRPRRLPRSRTSTKGCVAPRGGIEPPTRRLEGEALSASMV